MVAIAKFLSFLVLASSTDGALRRRLNPLDPRTVELKREDCMVKPDVPMLSQYLEDEIIFKKFYSRPLKCGGTVVEMGAFNGKTFSNSWFFEYALGWNSILVEANPKNFEQLKTNRPEATNIYGAMCLGDSISFQVTNNGATGGVADDMSQKHMDRWTDESHNEIVEVPCMLLANIFKERDISHVDVFFLDVEGGELTVLQTMDWNVQVDMWVIEMDGTDPLKDEAVRSVLRAHNYVHPGFKLQEECFKKYDQCMNSEVFVSEKYYARE